MRIVVKFAGALLEDSATVQSLSKHVAALAQQGHEILVIHGGGRIFTQTLKRFGIESKFVAGLRVTDRETRDFPPLPWSTTIWKAASALLATSPA